MDKFNIDSFTSDGNLYLIPPYISAKMQNRLKLVWKSQELRNHVFLCSSGTSVVDRIKTYAISKEAIIENAKAVNLFLKVKENDKWLSSLPFYHIGGLSIFIRAYLSKSDVVLNDSSWNPHEFIFKIEKNAINYTSLVPTQLYDLIKTQRQAPDSLKGVFVGGDFLSDELKIRALNLNWPIIQTYGMTETSSQVASEFAEKIVENKIPVLSIHKINIENKKHIIQSSSLFTREIIIGEKDIEIQNCPVKFELKDNILLEEKDEKQFIKPLGRKGSEFKLKGRLFNFLELQNMAHAVFMDKHVFMQADIALVGNERDGKELILVLEERIKHKKDDLIQCLNAIFPRTIQIASTRTYTKLPRTQLGKLKIS